MTVYDAKYADSGSSRNFAVGRLQERQDGRTRPECGSGDSNLHYNTPLHFIALVIILLLSTGACSFPIIARRFPRFPIPHRFLFLSRHFGTGVLIATAFVHLLPTAFVSLTDPCLPPFWNEGYPAMAGFIALMSVLVVVGVEMFFATRGAGHVHSDYGMVDQAPTRSTADLPSTRHAKDSGLETRSMRHFRHHSVSSNARDGVLYDVASNRDTDGTYTSIRPGSSSPLDQELDIETAASRNVDAAEQSPSRRRPDSSDGGSDDEQGHLRTEETGNGNVDAKTAQSLQLEEQKMLLQCLLLEAGILFHSVFIGMALSVATGTSFIVLLVAISFHQTFEGFALGSRIAAITSFGPRSMKPWLMALAYGTTTPIGQAIGLGVHNLYDPESEMGLIMVGVFNSLSSGLLLFAGLVELLAADFLSDESYQTLRGRKRLEACAAVVLGALLMALVGAWA